MAVKLEGSAKGFINEMKAAQASVKELASAGKLAEAQYRATGNAEEYQRNKSAALRQQIEAQRRAVEMATKALEAHAASGSNDAEAMQHLQSELNKAKTGLINLQTELTNVQAGTDKLQGGAKGAGQEIRGMAQVANSVRFTALNTALDNIGNAMTGIMNKAKSLGSTIWNAAKDAASYGDSLATDAARFGLDTKTLQQWQYASRFVDVEVQTIAASMTKLLGQMKKGSEAFDTLGVTTRTSGGQLRNTQQVFWESINALGRIGDESTRDSLAMDVFGKSFAELRPLVEAGRAAWEGYCDEAERLGLVLDDSQVEKLGAFDDSLQRMQATLDSLKNGILAEMAPAFQEISDAIGEAGRQLIAWTRSEAGQEAIGKMTDSIKTLIQTLANGGIEQLVGTVTGAFTKLSDLMAGAASNAETLLGTIKAIVAAVLGLRAVAGGIRLAASIKNLFNLGAGSAGAAGAGAAGAAGAGAAGAALPAGSAGALVMGAGAGGAGAGATFAAMGGAAAVASMAAMALGVIGGAGLASLLPQEFTADYQNRMMMLSGGEGVQRYDRLGAWRKQNLENAINTDEITQAIDDGMSKDHRAQVEAVTGAIQAGFEGVEINITNGPNSLGGIEIKTAFQIGKEWLTAAGAEDGIDKGEANALLEWVHSYLDPMATQAKIEAAQIWASVYGATQTPPALTVMAELAPKTEVEVLEFSAMTQWVSQKMGVDLANATSIASELWLKLLTAAGSPANLQTDLQQTASQAKSSGTNKTWNAMVTWVQKTMDKDKSAAEQIVTQMWRNLGSYAQAASKHAELNKDYNPEGTPSTIFQKYAEAIYGKDFEAAQTMISDWWAELEKLTPPAGSAGSVGAQDYAAQFVSGESKKAASELQKVKGELETILTGIANGSIKCDEATLTKLEELMTQAEGLAETVAQYTASDFLRGKGAYSLATAGVDYDENYAEAMAYVQNFKKLAKSDALKEYSKAVKEQTDAYDEYQKALGEYGPNDERTSKAKENADKAGEALKKAKETYLKRIEEIDAQVSLMEGAVAQGALIAAGITPAEGAVRGTVKAPAYVEVPTGTPTGAPGSITAPGGVVYQPRVENLPVDNGTIEANGGLYAWAGTTGHQITPGSVMGAGGFAEVANQLMRFGSASDAWAALSAGGLPFAGDLNSQSALLRAMRMAFGTEAADAATGGKLFGGGDENKVNASANNVLELLASVLADSEGKIQEAVEKNKKADENYRKGVEAEERYYTMRKFGGEGMDIVRQQIESGLLGGEGFDWSKLSGDLAGYARAAFIQMKDEGIDLSQYFGDITSFMEIGHDVDSGLSQGITDNLGEIEAAGSEAGKTAVDAVADGAETHSPSAATERTGMYIVQGLTLGIQEHAGEAIAAARALAEQIKATIQEALEIHSPSHLMRDFGRYTGEGLALGLNDMVSTVGASAAAVADATADGIVSRGGRGNGGNTYYSDPSINIGEYYGGSDSDVYALSDKLADIQRKERLGRGIR